MKLFQSWPFPGDGGNATGAGAPASTSGDVKDPKVTDGESKKTPWSEEQMNDAYRSIDKLKKKLKAYEDADEKRIEDQKKADEESAKKRGEHEKVIEMKDIEIKKLKDELAAEKKITGEYLEREKLECEDLIKKLPDDDRKFVQTNSEGMKFGQLKNWVQSILSKTVDTKNPPRTFPSPSQPAKEQVSKAQKEGDMLSGLRAQR